MANYPANPRLIVRNKTSAYPSDSSDGQLLEQIIRVIIEEYLRVYPFCRPSCSAEIILCENNKHMEEEWRRYYGHHPEKEFPIEYDGQFLPAVSKSDVLTILACVNANVISGAEQYLYEKENGSLKNAPTDERGLKMLPFWHFVELVMHEFSHLASYDKLMLLTNWTNPSLPIDDLDYHLHDEFITRIRGIYAMLLMAEPYMETDMLYSLYVGYINDEQNQFLKRMDSVRELDERYRDNIRRDLAHMQRQLRLSNELLAEEIEKELGHPLEYGGAWEDGALKLSKLEIIEFYAVDEFEEMMKPLLYIHRNSFAVYEGTQFAGASAGFFQAMTHMEGQENHFSNLMIAEDELHLENVIDIPFWKYFDLEKIKKQNDVFRELLVQRTEKEALYTTGLLTP